MRLFLLNIICLLFVLFNKFKYFSNVVFLFLDEFIIVIILFLLIFKLIFFKIWCELKCLDKFLIFKILCMFNFFFCLFVF